MVHPRKSFPTNGTVEQADVAAGCADSLGGRPECRVVAGIIVLQNRAIVAMRRERFAVIRGPVIRVRYQRERAIVVACPRGSPGRESIQQRPWRVRMAAQVVI